MDSALIPLSIPGLNLIQTTDFFYPLVDDPFMQGRIAAANVLSDLYAMGTTKCDNLLMLLGIPKKFTEKERDVVVPLVIKGFKDAADEAGSQVTGGQTVINPWFLVGGVATAVCHKEEFVMPNMAEAGDVLVLTKPLGTQIAVNAHQWLEQPDRWQKIQDVVTEEEVECAYQEAMFNMASLNKNAASLMKKFNAHAATDVTGFGILGHAKNLAEHQSKKLKFVINKLPIISKMADTAEACGIKFKLLQGYSAETSGGLLIAMPANDAEGFVREFEQLNGNGAWIIGNVENSTDPDAVITDNPQIIEVKTKIH